MHIPCVLLLQHPQLQWGGQWGPQWQQPLPITIIILTRAFPSIQKARSCSLEEQPQEAPDKGRAEAEEEQGGELA